MYRKLRTYWGETTKNDVGKGKTHNDNCVPLRSETDSCRQICDTGACAIQN